MSGQYGRAVTTLWFVGGGENVRQDPARTVRTIREPPRQETKLCLVCGDGATDLGIAMHPTGTCAVWRSLSLKDNKDKVNCVK